MNGTMVQYFEWYLESDSTLWKKVTADAKNLAEQGFTAIWLPPAYKGADGVNDVGYGVYDTYDLGEFDQKGTVPTKYGTRKEYLGAVKELHRQGIDVYADIVLNHRMGADETEWLDAVEVNPSDRNQVTSGNEKIEAYTKFTFPGRKGKYSDFIWIHENFDGVDWDASSQRNRIFEFVGKSWQKDVDTESGNYDYLMGADVDFDNQAAVDELYRWGEWYYETVGMDGFRLDAVKHIESDFYLGWLSHLREKYGREFFTVGEYWNGNVDVLLKYLDRVQYCMSLFDAPLHYNFYTASRSDGNYDMRTIFDNTMVQRRPDKAVTLVGNHDTEGGQALESWIEGWFRPLAYAMILLRQEGYPCVFYGDLYGIPHNGVNPIGEKLTKMVKLRQTHAYGWQHDYLDDPNVIGWTREGDQEGPGLACLLTDSAAGSKIMYVGKGHAGETWTPVFGGEEVRIGDDGCALFSVGGGDVAVYIPKYS